MHACSCCCVARLSLTSTQTRQFSLISHPFLNIERSLLCSYSGIIQSSDWIKVWRIFNLFPKRKKTKKKLKAQSCQKSNKTNKTKSVVIERSVNVRSSARLRGPWILFSKNKEYKSERKADDVFRLFQKSPLGSHLSWSEKYFSDAQFCEQSPKVSPHPAALSWKGSVINFLGDQRHGGKENGLWIVAAVTQRRLYKSRS